MMNWPLIGKVALQAAIIVMTVMVSQLDKRIK